jgi:DNA-binding Lrp family transcriptional regulator
LKPLEGDVEIPPPDSPYRPVRLLPEVSNAEVVTGTFDIIASIEVSNMAAMADLVTSQMQSIRGVIKTITCVTAG